MSVKCDMIRDLADVYESGKASAGTKKAIEEHLDACPYCSEYYLKRQEMRKPYLRIETSGDEEAQIARNLERLSKRLKTRQMISAVCATVTVLFGLASLLLELMNEYRKKD